MYHHFHDHFVALGGFHGSAFVVEILFVVEAQLCGEAFGKAEGDACRKPFAGGIYCLAPKAIHTLRRCMDEGQSRMRNFQRALVADGLKLKACPFSKILDVDHAEDIRKAEEFLSDNNQKY